MTIVHLTDRAAFSAPRRLRAEEIALLRRVYAVLGEGATLRVLRRLCAAGRD